MNIDEIKVLYARYKECGDKYARNFLKGFGLKHRG